MQLCTRVPAKQSQQVASAAVHVVQVQSQTTLASDLSSSQGRQAQAQPRWVVQLSVEAQPPKKVILRGCHACQMLEQSHSHLAHCRFPSCRTSFTRAGILVVCLPAVI